MKTAWHPKNSLPALLTLAQAAMTGCAVGPPATPPAQPPLSAVTVSASAQREGRAAVPQQERLSAYGNPPYYEVDGQRYQVAHTSDGYVERGVASWYGPNFHGKRAASGETYDMYAMSAAHKTLPLPTYVSVTNLENGRAAVVRVNDRGPFKKNRLIDLSYAAARELDLIEQGTALVEIRALGPDERAARPHVQRAAAALPRLFIQVGAFEQRSGAFHLRDRLQGTLIPRIRIRPMFKDGTAMFRVQVGPLDSVEEADRMVEILANLGVEDYRMAIDWDD